MVFGTLELDSVRSLPIEFASYKVPLLPGSSVLPLGAA